MNKPANYPTITVVICTLNEAESLPQVLPKIPDWVDEIILVDGHSTDDTIQIVKVFTPEYEYFIRQGKVKVML